MARAKNLDPETGRPVKQEKAEALGGDRRNFTAGETLPTVLIPASRNLIQKLKGAPQNQLAETVWTLIALPKSTTAA